MNYENTLSCPTHLIYNRLAQGRTQGVGLGLGSTPPWAWYFTKSLLPSQRRL